MGQGRSSRGREMKFQWQGRFGNEIPIFKIKFHIPYYKMKLHYHILYIFFIDFLYNLCYNKRGNININIGFCQQVLPPLASLGAVLIIYIPQLGLRPRSFIYIIRIREIIIYRKCVFFFAYLYTGDGGRQKMLHFFTTFFRQLARRKCALFGILFM